MSGTLFPELAERAPQGELFAPEIAGPRDYRPDLEKVRARLNAMLVEARAANTLPWTHAKTRLYRTIFPQMSLWLPDSEAEQLRFDFEREMARLLAA